MKTNKTLKKFQPSEVMICKKAYHNKDKKPQTDPLKIVEYLIKLFVRLLRYSFSVIITFYKI